MSKWIVFTGIDLDQNDDSKNVVFYEFLKNITDVQKEVAKEKLKYDTENTLSNFASSLSSMKMRARYNSQNHYKISIIEADEDYVEDMFEKLEKGLLDKEEEQTFLRLIRSKGDASTY